VKKLIARGPAVVGAATVSIVMFGSGVAAADDYAGQTYADASSALSDAGMTGIISTVVGSRLPIDECLVTHSRMAPFVRDVGDAFAHTGSEVLLSLNCNAAVASANAPGNSAGSSVGSAAKKKQESIEWRSRNPEWCALTESEHPEWAPLEGCHQSD
jgi:hypothetical protein